MVDMDNNMVDKEKNMVDMDKDMVDMVGTNLEWEIHKRKLGMMTLLTLSKRLLEAILEEIVCPTALKGGVATSLTNGVASHNHTHKAIRLFKIVPMKYFLISFF